MKKIVSFLLVILAALIVTGCGDMGTGVTEEYEFCREYTVIAGGAYSGYARQYEAEYLKKTGCRSIETCDKVVQLTITECQ